MAEMGPNDVQGEPWRMLGPESTQMAKMSPDIQGDPGQTPGPSEDTTRPESAQMGEMGHFVKGDSGQRPRPVEDEEDIATHDVHGVAMKIQGAKVAYKAYGGLQEKPSKGEVLGWCLYGLCSYFIYTVLIPIVFPLIISQAMKLPPEPAHGREKSYKGLYCKQNEMQLYEAIAHRSIKVNNMNFSPLEWTSISWVTGLILAAPLLGIIAIHLDHSQTPHLIAGAVTAIGPLFCLPAGFFKTTRIFPLYITAIAVANTVGAAFHARHLGLMVQGFIGSFIRKSQFHDRRAVGSWLSLYATAAGCLGSATFSAFIYHMLQGSDNFNSLWIVSIFSGLIWFVGIAHIFTANRSGANTSSSSRSNTFVFSIFTYPHAAGTLAGVFLSSFSTMCLFTGGVIYVVGQICLEPKDVLYLWLTYFIFPLLSLPLLHPLQHLIQADAVKMQLLGFLLSTLTSGFGFYYRHENWRKQHVLLFAAVQSTATGLLHAFGRVLLLDCSPAGKEGAFSAWLSWVRALGSCAGFAFASTGGGNVNRSFGVAFCMAIVGIVVLIFGNISNFGGAVAAGLVREHSEKGSPVHGLDIGDDQVRGSVSSETPHQGKVAV